MVVSLSIPGGTCPVKLLLARLRAYNLDAMASNVGISPLRLFPPRKRYRRSG